MSTKTKTGKKIGLDKNWAKIKPKRELGNDPRKGLDTFMPIAMIPTKTSHLIQYKKSEHDILRNSSI